MTMRIIDPATWPIHPVGKLVAIAPQEAFERPSSDTNIARLVATGPDVAHVNGEAGQLVLCRSAFLGELHTFQYGNVWVCDESAIIAILRPTIDPAKDHNERTADAVAKAFR